VVREGEGDAVVAPAPPGDDLAERYLWYLDVGCQALVDALTLLGDPASFPLVFHCAAGKDRTGVLAALVLEILGVEREIIVADYVITAERMELIMGRYRADPALAARLAKVPASRFSVQADTRPLRRSRPPGTRGAQPGNPWPARHRFRRPGRHRGRPPSPPFRCRWRHPGGGTRRSTT